MRFAVFLAVVLSIWALEHLYVGFRLASLPLFAAGVGRRVLLFGLLLGFLSYPLGRILFAAGWRVVGRVVEYLGAAWMGTLFLLFALLLVSEIVTLVGFAPRPWTLGVRTTAVVLALVAAGLAWIGGIRAPRLVDEEVVLPGLPAEAEGLTIALVSDVHLGTLLGRARWNEVLERVAEARPDLVALAGDLVDADAGVVEQMVGDLRRLRAPLGVWAVLGNHEHYAGPERSRRLLAEAGYTVLDNEAAEIRPGLWVAGVPDARGARQTGSLPADLGTALEGVPTGAAVILLQHSPEEEARAAAAGVGLMLSGHTHGGQLWPFGALVRLTYPHIAGVYTESGMVGVVSRGAGWWGPPMRLGAPAEVWRIVLRSPHGEADPTFAGDDRL